MTHSSVRFAASLILGTLVLTWPCGGLTQRLPRPTWTHYRNARWGFCLSYPSTWGKDEGTDKAGVSVFPPQKACPPGPRSKIAVGALPNQAQDLDNPVPHGPPMTLEQNFEEGIRPASTMQQDVVVLKKRRITFGGHPAIVSKVRYRDPVDGATWVSVDILFQVEHGWVVYALDLTCRPDELSKLEPIFNEIAYRTFKLRCAPPPKN